MHSTTWMSRVSLSQLQMNLFPVFPTPKLYSVITPLNDTVSRIITVNIWYTSNLFVKINNSLWLCFTTGDNCYLSRINAECMDVSCIICIVFVYGGVLPADADSTYAPYLTVCSHLQMAEFWNKIQEMQRQQQAWHRIIICVVIVQIYSIQLGQRLVCCAVSVKWDSSAEP